MKFDPFNWRDVQPGPVIGVDEVGRGCLAGPVYAAAVILDPARPYTHFTDSKLLSAIRREQMAKEIRTHHQVGLGFATVLEIDQMNILQAALLAMKRAVQNLGVTCGHLLVDGNIKVPGLPAFAQTTLIKGDLRAHPIGAASIVAKVTRDQRLTELEELYPEYGFAKHKGYSTVVHKAAIARLGPCPEHRRTFAGVKEHCTVRI
ncbi:MAG: ribonuclease HII [Bdellovibrionales bacterium]